MKIESMTTESLREYMGHGASEEDARRMMAILTREGVCDTRDASDQQWAAWCAEASPRNFDRNMLPLLGVVWHYFSTVEEAMAFANWAEEETRNDEHPCDAYVTQDDLRPLDSRFEVMVRNW